MADRLPAFYVSKNIGNHKVVGYVSKYTYGHFGGGTMVPDGAFPEDIRARPYLFVCGNCRSPFTITESGEVMCPNCSRAQIETLTTGRPAARVAELVDMPQEPPPPPDIVWEEPEVQPSVKIRSLDFGGHSHDRYCRILEEAGIITLDDAIEAGKDGLMEIKGIGPTIARDILKHS